jgi:hypothetical protein
MRTNTIKRRIAEAAEWPSIRETADDWELPERYVRGLVERGLVRSVHIDRIRIDPDSFEAYMEEMLE